MQYTDVGEKTNTPFFVLIVFGSLSPFSGGQKRLLRRPDIFWHSLPSKETKMLQMLCCRRYCCLYNRQISAQKATSWGSLLSKFHCWENSSLVERFQHKAGTVPFLYRWYKVRRDDGAELFRECCQAGILMTWSSSSSAHCGSYTMQDTQQLRHTSIPHGVANGSGMCWPPGKEMRDRGMSLPKIIFKMHLSAEKARSAAQALCSRSQTSSTRQLLHLEIEVKSQGKAKQMPKELTLWTSDQGPD